MISAATEHPNVVQYIGSYHIPGRGSGDAEVEEGWGGGFRAGGRKGAKRSLTG